MKRINILLFFVVLIAFVSRFWQVTSVPPSLYWDEVSQGYNAYSILKTGRDEHQEFMPLARFQAFGDYKAPVYTYLMVPSLAIFGKTELAVRMPSIIFGSLTVLLVYFLVQKLFITYEKRQLLGLLAAFFLSISPWHIQLSRAAFEANIATFFTILGITCFFWAIRERPWMLICSAISFVLALYSFNAHRIFVPLFVVFLSLLEWKIIYKLKKQVLISALLGIVLLIPFLGFIRTPESKLRFQEVNIFSNGEIVKKANSLILQEGDSVPAKIVHNRRVLFAQEYLKHYFDFFHPTYLFFTGDVNPRFSDQQTGELFLWMLPLLLIGAFSLLSNWNKNSIILLGWFLLAPIAAATARETPHALRSETFIPIYEIIAAFGTITIGIFCYKYLKKFSIGVAILFIVIIGISLIDFWHNYLTHNPVTYSEDWQYGYKQTIQKVKTIESRYDQIYFTDAYGRAYIYVAWYGDFSPEKFSNEIERKKDVYGLYTVSKLGKYVFTDTFPKEQKGRILFVTTPSNIPTVSRKIETVSFLDGKPAFVISEKL